MRNFEGTQTLLESIEKNKNDSNPSPIVEVFPIEVNKK
jgi:hypothetical protein